MYEMRMKQQQQRQCTGRMMISYFMIFAILISLSWTYHTKKSLRIHSMIPLQSYDYHHTSTDEAMPLLRSTSHSTNDTSNNHNHNNNTIQWHIKPIKPLHHGKVVYLTGLSDKDNSVIYQRIFTAPCGDGMLVFNVGPAAEYEPYTYELYDDAYAYSNNEGLCVLYPSYRGIQTASYPLWAPTDSTELIVPLGDIPTQISTRIVTPPHSKNFNHTSTYRGGDFLIIRSGNFYNPTYYKHLKNNINNWPEMMTIDDMNTQLLELQATL